MGDARNEHAGPAEEAAVREPRTSRLLRGEISSSRFGTARIVVRNISAGGLGGKCDQVLLKGEKVAVLLNNIDPVEATIVWSQGRLSACSSIKRSILRRPSLRRSSAKPSHMKPRPIFVRRRPHIGRDFLENKLARRYGLHCRRGVRPFILACFPSRRGACRSQGFA